MMLLKRINHKSVKTCALCSVCLILFICFTSNTFAQTLGGYNLIDCLDSADHPNGCSSNYVLGYPNDSTWVNLDSNTSVVKGYFQNSHMNVSGDELLIETSFNRDNYSVRLIKSGGTFSNTLSVTENDWVFLDSINWTYTFVFCLGGTLHYDRYILPLDFDTDFNISPTESVIGIEITFLNSPGHPDLAGVYICQPAAPLPIELLDFKLAQQSKSIILNWSTHSEINNDYFTLEKSKDAKNWVSFKSVKGAGNSTNTINYNDVDNNPYQGVSYYRLKQTDFDGKFSYSNIEAINFSNDDLSIFPNPTNNIIAIHCKNCGLNSATVQLLDITGKVILIKTGVTKIDLTPYSSGVYFLKVNTINNRHIEKIIKN